jgi:cytoskeleton protein RodZ
VALFTAKPFSWYFSLLYNIAMTLPIGEKLRQERLARKLSLEQVAQQTRIRIRYLEALEQGELDSLPSLTQARGFIRTYAQYLKIDPEPFLADLGGEKVIEKTFTEASAPAENAYAAQADAILADLGAKLRQQRELLGLSVEDVERHTHIRAHYLNALEAGELSELPSPVQGRGMLNNYAIFLGFDPEPLLLRFAEGLQVDLAARQAARASTLPAKTRKTSNRGKGRRFFSIDLLAGGFLVLFILGFIIWGGLRISSVRSEDQPTPTSPSIAEVLAPDTATPTPSITPQPNLDPNATDVEANSTPSPPLAEQTTEPQETQLPAEPPQVTPTSTLPPFDASSVQVYIVIRQRAWVRVTVDGTVELDGRVLPGSAYLFTGNELIEILTGNGAALQVYFNQQDQGVLGQFGEIVKVSFSPSGEVQPIATPTSLPTATEQPEPTSNPTPTATSLP